MSSWTLMRTGRRGGLALALALGLVLMHGGIGQAMTCNGMAQMSGAAMPVMGATSMPVHDAVAAGEHAQHHPPANEPVAAHSSQMCLSTPATTSGGDSKAGSSVVDLISDVGALSTPYVATVTRASGREPPAPDLVSVLCVNRV